MPRKIALVLCTSLLAVGLLVTACSSGSKSSPKPTATSVLGLGSLQNSVATAVGGGGSSVVNGLSTAVSGNVPAPLATAASGLGLGDLGSLLGDSSSTTVKVRTASTGKILTDSKGMTLYTSNRDTAGSGKSGVTGGVLANWPALILASGTPTKGDGVTGDVTLITRDDGAKQVAYKGLPLYYWMNDKQPGDTTGNNVGGFTVAMP